MGPVVVVRGNTVRYIGPRRFINVSLMCIHDWDTPSMILVEVKCLLL